MFPEKAPSPGTRRSDEGVSQAGRLPLVRPCTADKIGFCLIHLPLQRAFSESFSRETVCEGVDWSEGSRGMGAQGWRFRV